MTSTDEHRHPQDGQEPHQVHHDVHGHENGHHHHHGIGGHAPSHFGRAFAIGIALNLGFVAVEAIFGLAAGSVALLADAGHNVSDVLGLAVAWAAVALGALPPSQRFTYGLGKTSILAALLNALILLVGMGGIAWEAIRRLGSPEPVAGLTVMVVAAIGIAVNAATAWLFAAGSRGDLNIRGAFLHMAVDALVSLGVVIAGVLIMVTGWSWLDPATSLCIVAVVLWSTWGLLRDAVLMSLAGVPPGIDVAEVLESVRELPGVESVHDLHVWPMSTTETAMTAHLVMPDGSPGDAFIREAENMVAERFGIGHATFQVERKAEACNLVHAAAV